MNTILIKLHVYPGSREEESEQLFQVSSCLGQLHGYTHLYLIHAGIGHQREKSAKMETEIGNRFWPGTLIVATKTMAACTLAAGERKT